MSARREYRTRVVIAAVALAWMAGCARPWLGGIHASLRMQARGGLVVDRVDSDGPAGRAGLRAGESVLAIDGVATSELTADELRDRVRGDVGTWVVLRVRASDGAERDVSVERGP